MKVDLGQVIIDFDGSEVEKVGVDGKGTGKSLTLRDVVIVSLSTPLKGDENDTGEVRIQKFDILDSIHKSKDGKINLEAKDVELLKGRVLKVYPSPVVYKNYCKAAGEKK